MVEIKNTTDADLKRNYDDKWRESQDAKRLLLSKVDDNCASSVPQSDVDAIANAMDAADMQEQMPIENQGMPVLGDATDLPVQDFNPSKDQVIASMMQNYVQQNGGIVQDNQESIKKDQTLFG